MNKISSLALALFIVSATLPAALALESAGTNQPNNGFHEGSDPEWATLHSTDSRGTTEHRQYHRDGVKSHLAWHADHRATKNTPSTLEAHRFFHQERNSDHRHFHTEPVNP